MTTYSTETRASQYEGVSDGAYPVMDRYRCVCALALVERLTITVALEHTLTGIHNQSLEWGPTLLNLPMSSLSL